MLLPPRRVLLELSNESHKNTLQLFSLFFSPSTSAAKKITCANVDYMLQISWSISSPPILWKFFFFSQSISLTADVKECSHALRNGVLAT